MSFAERGMNSRRLPGIRLFQTAAEMALPIETPIWVQSDRSEMASATSWCGTDACDATWEATTENEPPIPMRTWEMTRRAVSWTPCRRARSKKGEALQYPQAFASLVGCDARNGRPAGPYRRL